MAGRSDPVVPHLLCGQEIIFGMRSDGLGQHVFIIKPNMINHPQQKRTKISENSTFITLLTATHKKKTYIPEALLDLQHV